jgi:hypothetical protein
MATRIRRHEFITALGGAVAGCRSRRVGDRVRRTGVLMPWDENDPFWKPGLATRFFSSTFSASSCFWRLKLVRRFLSVATSLENR